MRTLYEEWSILDRPVPATSSVEENNLADVSAKIEDEAAIQIWQTHLPNFKDFPIDDFLHIGFSHHTVILSKVKGNRQTQYV